MTKLLSGLVILIVAGVAYLVCEGAYSLWRAGQPGVSLAYQLHASARQRGQPPGGPPAELADRVIVHQGQIEPLLDSFRAHGVGLGNTPFDELRTELAALNHVEDGCQLLKPSAHKTMTYLRSLLHDPFNPPMAFFDADQRLPPEVVAFFAAYGRPPARLPVEPARRAADPAAGRAAR